MQSQTPERFGPSSDTPSERFGSSSDIATRPESDPVGDTTTAGGAFYGAAKLLPGSIQKHLPEFLTGPSAGEQMVAGGEKVAAEEKRLGRPLTLKERLAVEPVTESPVAMGFATHQLGGDVPVPKIGGAGRGEFARAAKPSRGSITAAGGREQYYSKAEGAIHSIIENRPNLQFVDADGNVVAGELPKSLDQLSDAIDQTKAELYKKYNTMAQQAGMYGAAVDLRPIVPELNRLATDEVMNDFFPGVAQYAAEKANTLMARGGYYAEDAQRAIQYLNATLKGSYGNSDPNLVVRGIVDRMIANKLRAGLDQTVENYVGPGYQEFKNQYGELKAVEADVKNRAAVVARQEKGGGLFGRLVDVASADEVLRGLATLHLDSVATGGALQAFKQWVKWRRDPNTAVTNLFRRATTPVVSPSPMSPIAPISQQQSGVAAADPSATAGLMAAQGF